MIDQKFLLSELANREFVKKYKRTILGTAWSMISPLVNLLVLWFVFNRIFGSSIPHYTIYLFSGQIIFNFFTDSTSNGALSLYANKDIISKIKVPKYMFVLSQQISSSINFFLTLIIYFIFVAIDGIIFTPKFLLLLYAIICLIIYNTGLSLILSAMYVFFRDTQYLWNIATQLIMWMSAIFYSIDSFPKEIHFLFMLNPIYIYITYFRDIVINGVVPSLGFHFLMILYSLVSLGIGAYIYKKYDKEFIYYL